MTKKKRQPTMLNSKLNFALRIVTTLYRRNQTTSVETLSKELDVSVSYIEQVLASLRKGGIVKAFRGASGGYRIVGKTVLVRDVILSINPLAFEYEPNKELLSMLEDFTATLSLSELCGLER